MKFLVGPFHVRRNLVGVLTCLAHAFYWFILFDWGSTSFVVDSIIYFYFYSFFLYIITALSMNIYFVSFNEKKKKNTSV